MPWQTSPPPNMHTSPVIFLCLLSSIDVQVFHTSATHCDCVRFRITPTRSPSFFFFNDTATTEIYTLSLHDALPISNACFLVNRAGIGGVPRRVRCRRPQGNPPRSPGGHGEGSLGRSDCGGHDRKPR